MTPEDALASLQKKQFFKLSGTPEHWLTAVKFNTWGLRLDQLSQWQKIEVGDVFLMHSIQKSDFDNARPSIIGVGIVGTDLRQKTTYLWQEEFEKGQNIYPLLVPFSEIYLFSDIGDIDSWDAANRDQTQLYIDKLLKDGVAIPKGFNVMGSISSIRDEVAFSILKNGLPRHERDGNFDLENFRTTHTTFQKVEKSTDTLRYVPTLKHLAAQDVVRRLEKKYSTFERDNELLERANRIHQQIIDESIGILRAKGFETLSNLHVDLAAENEKEILILEAKSIPEKKFRTQARTAIGQLYQYEYFDIKDYQDTRGTNKSVQKLLLVPHDPSDEPYVTFLKSIGILSQFPSDGELMMIG